MYQTARAIGAYRNAQMTIPPLQVVVMLYDGILARIARAADAHRAHDYERQFNEVMAAARIVDGLNRCLDLEAGGAVAAHLRSFYSTIAGELLRSTGREYGAPYLERLAVAVRVTRDAWAEIAGVSSNAESVQN
jgi:flagellar biosynthetic protein FliS